MKDDKRWRQAAARQAHGLGIAAGLIGGGMLATGPVFAQADPDGFLPLRLASELGRRPGAAPRRPPRSALPAQPARPPAEPPAPALIPAPALGLRLAAGPARPGPAGRANPGGPSSPTGPGGRSTTAGLPARPTDRDPEPEAPVPFEAVQGLPVRRDGAAARAAAQELPDLSGSTWHLAPIRWGGNASATLNQFKEDNGNRTTSNTQMVNLRTASHIYQPWFAQVTGNLGLVTGSSQRTLAGSSQSSDTRTTAWNYGGSLNLFPLSRFPFQAYLDHSDNRATANLTGTQYTSSRLGLRQSYRPPTGTDSYALSYDRSQLTADAGSSTVDALQGNYSASLAEHSISANARYASNTGGLNGESSRLMSATGSHLWRMEDGLSVASTANFSDQEIRYLSSGLLSMNNNRLMQAASTFTWTPDEDLPLTVTGGANALAMQTRTDTASNQMSSLGANAGFMYRFTSRFTGSGNFQVSQTSSGSARNQLMGGTGSLSYSGEPLTLGNFNYNWNLGTTATAQSVSGGQALNSLSGQAGHGLARSIALSPANVLSLNVSQSASVGTNSQYGQTTTLVHSAGLSWRLGYSERLTGLFGTVVSDNLTTGQYSSHYRTFNLNGNGILQLSRRASFNANANLAWSQQKIEDKQLQQQQQLQLGQQLYTPNSSQWTGSAALGYTHRSPFGVPNLNYNISGQFTSSQVNQRLVNADPNAMAWQTSRSLQQRLEYRIGRLTFQVLNGVATVNGKKNASLYFQVNRDFGAF